MADVVKTNGAALTVPKPDVQQRGDTADFVRQMVKAHNKYVAWLARSYQIDRGEAAEKAKAHVSTVEEREADLRKTPLDQVGWWSLNDLMEHNPDLVRDKWAEIKQAARDELDSGARAAITLDSNGPWDRARFLAIRQSFIDEWQPRGGVELALIDQMAQAYTGWLHWLGRFGSVQHDEWIERSHRDKDYRLTGAYVTPRLSLAETSDQAFRMADRFNRLFMRTLRGLRDLRRYTPTITIHNEGQVNIGQNQVNQSG